MQCALTGKPYTIFGYKGKQVRDNIHAQDVVNAFWHFFQRPRTGEVYNLGGGRHSNISMLEAVAACETLTGKKMTIRFSDEARIGDHKWWISDMRKFQRHYPEWSYTYGIEDILQEIHDGIYNRPHSRHGEKAI
jgi:CDP-paratose 2-epimerase